MRGGRREAGRAAAVARSAFMKSMAVTRSLWEASLAARQNREYSQDFDMAKLILLAGGALALDQWEGMLSGDALKAPASWQAASLV